MKLLRGQWLKPIRDMDESIKDVVLMKLSRIVKENGEWLSITLLENYRRLKDCPYIVNFEKALSYSCH